MTATRDVDDSHVPGLVEQLFGLDQASIDAPFPIYKLMREHQPLFRSGSVVAVSRYADVKNVLRDATTFSSVRLDGSKVKLRRTELTPEDAFKYDALVGSEGMWVSEVDDPYHARLRRFVNAIFSAGRIAQLRDQVEATTRELLDEIDARGHEEFELISDFSFKLPLRIICGLFGATGPESENIRVWSEHMGEAIGTDYQNIDDAYDALVHFQGYVQGLIERGRAGDGGGTELFLELMSADAEGQVLTDDELVAMFIQLLFAGHETTTNLIANAIIALQDNPDQLAILQGDPTLIRPAVDEFLRYCGSIHAVHRVATKDCEIAGFPVKAGETVRALVAAANHDPSAFEDPDALDVTRKNARQHVGLGFGIHTCLGQWLTRLETEVALTELLRRYPEMSIVGDAHMRQNLTLHGPRELRIQV